MPTEGPLAGPLPLAVFGPGSQFILLFIYLFIIYSLGAYHASMKSRKGVKA